MMSRDKIRLIFEKAGANMRKKEPGLLSIFALCALLSTVGNATAYAVAAQSRYEVGTDTVRDSKTGLTWQRAHPTSNLRVNEAASYCDGLALAGKDDWRVPTLRELQSIVDYTEFGAAIDKVAFPNTAAYYFWSATPYKTGCFTINFDEGMVSSGGGELAILVRCVRK
jgi:hypothetical protein